MTGAPLRARDPDEVGWVVRGGVRIGYEVTGAGDTTLLLMPAWSIVNSRFWKLQVPYLARYFRVVTFDGRGSGRSDRPLGAAAYTHEQYVDDTVAVLDATGTDRAVLVALSLGGTWAVRVAADHPDRVLGVFAMGPACGFADPGAPVTRGVDGWAEPVATPRGWAKYNRHHWLNGGYDDFLSFFFGAMFPEPHSTKPVEDCVGWGRELDPQTLVDTAEGESGRGGAVATPLEPFCARVRCPVVVVHGSDDVIVPAWQGERLADLTGGSFVLMEGVGHGPPGRHPVRVNLMIREFAEQLRPPVVRRASPTALAELV